MFPTGRGIEAVIPTRTDEAPEPGFDRTASQERNVAERLIDRLKQHRRIATGYEERAVNFPAMLTVACILL
jgi:transposase